MNWTEFLAMGGYAAFVWPSFGLTLIVLILNVRAARRLHATAREETLRRLDSGRTRP
jgi:heme exporter protein CcmD